MEERDSIELDSSGSAGNTSEDTNAGNTQPSYQPPSNPQPSYQPPSTNSTPAGSNPTTFQINVRVRSDNTNNGWTNSGLVVRRGQRLRINASGRVNLGNNRFSTPDGLPNVPDRDKLMRNQPTGGLSAVICDG